MNDTLTYKDTEVDDIVRVSSSSSFTRFSGGAGIDDEPISITLHTSRIKIEKFHKIFDDYTIFQNKKEDYCINAIRNLIVKNNFLALTLEHAEKQLTEDEYSSEIEKNPDKYIINVEYLKDPNDIIVINEVVKRIGLEFSIDEVAELFSLDTQDIELNVAQIK